MTKKSITQYQAHSHLQCISCGASYALDKQLLYRCMQTNCGGLLDIHTDTATLQKKSADWWRKLMRERWGDVHFPFTSGVWNKKEWVLPDIANEHIVSLGEGKTPLLALADWAQELELDSVWLKQCGISHSGSFKDLGMTVLVSHVKQLLAKGHPIRAIACASTGDTSAALAAYAAYAGIAAIVILPVGKISNAQLTQPLACGALALSLQTDFDGCMRIVQELTRDSSIYLANSMNPLRLAGQRTMGIEVVQQLAWNAPDWFIIPGGNLGNVSALVSGLQLIYELGLIDKLPRVCVAQSAHANPLFLSYRKNFSEYKAVTAQKTLASAIQIGDPVSYPRAVAALRQCNGIVEQATEAELANAAARVDRYGMFNDPHTGVALACLQKLCASANRIIAKGARVVVVSTAHGLKFSESKRAYHSEQLDFKANYANQPIELEASSAAVLRALDKYLRVSAN